MTLTSIILPSLRQKLAQQSLLALERCCRGAHVEIILVSPFELHGQDVKWIPEHEPRGNAAAHNQGYQAASGDYIIHLSDDVLPVPGWLDAVIGRIDEREQRHFPFVLGLRVAQFQFSTVYGHYFANFPALSRRSAEAIGGTFTTEFAAHFADADLSMRAWSQGGRCECLQTPLLYYVPIERFLATAHHKQSSIEKDCDTFIGKWGARYGAGWGKTHRALNVDYPISRLVDDSFVVSAPPRELPPAPAPRLHGAALQGSVRRVIAAMSPAQLYRVSRLIGRAKYQVRP